MYPALTYGNFASTAMLMVCCLVGLVLFARRAHGRMRLFGILGTSILLAERLLGMVWAFFGAALWMSPSGAIIGGAVALLVALLQAAGLVLIGMSVATRRRRTPEEGAP